MSRSRRNPKDYWYPDMSNAVIVDSLNERGISVTHHQLVNPTPQSNLGIYSGCLRLLTGLSSESLREPIDDVLIALDEPILVCVASISLWLSPDLAGHIRPIPQHQHLGLSHVCLCLVLINLKVAECVQITFGECGKGARFQQQGHLPSHLATNPHHPFRPDQLYQIL